MTRQMRALACGAAALSLLAAAACQGTQALEDIESGTTVVIETEDGRLVAGQLTHVDPDQVRLAAAGTDRQIAIDRSGIATVRTADDEDEVPDVRELMVPAGTALRASLETPLASDRSRVEDAVRATLTEPLMAGDATVAPAGAVLSGTVVEVQQAGRVKGRSRVAIRFDRLQAGGVTWDIRTAPLVYVGEATKSEDAAKIGTGAAVGAIIGGIAGGGKGAAIGSAVGGGGGTAVVLSTRGEEIEVGAGRPLSIELTEALTVTVPAD